jgi:hypothetical protein
MQLSKSVQHRKLINCSPARNVVNRRVKPRVPRAGIMLAADLFPAKNP